MTDSRIDKEKLVKYIRIGMKKSEMSKLFDVSPKTLYNTMKKYNLYDAFKGRKDVLEILEHTKCRHRDKPEKIEELVDYSTELIEKLFDGSVSYAEAMKNSKEAPCLFVKKCLELFG